MLYYDDAGRRTTGSLRRLYHPVHGEEIADEADVTRDVSCDRLRGCGSNAVIDSEEAEVKL